eukprot:3934742-Rhodomonas_salina.2
MLHAKVQSISGQRVLFNFTSNVFYAPQPKAPLHFCSSPRLAPPTSSSAFSSSHAEASASLSAFTAAKTSEEEWKSTAMKLGCLPSSAAHRSARSSRKGFELM